MALSESGTTNITPTGGEQATDISAVKLAADIAIVVYRRLNGSNQTFARIGDVSSGSLSAGAEQEIGSSLDTHPDIDRLTNTKALMEYVDGNDGDDGKLRTLSVSGTTITENSAATYETSSVLLLQHRVAVVSAALGVVGYRIASGTTHRLCRFTISGDTVSPSAPVAHSSDTTGIAKGAIALSSTKVFYMYTNNAGGISCQVLDIASGITQGTPSAIPSVTDSESGNGLKKSVAALTSTKGIAVFHQTGNKLSAVVANISGNTISSYGTVFDIDTGASVLNISVGFISSTKVLIMYKDSSSATAVETLNISGDTITKEGDKITLTQSGGNQNNIPIVVNTKAIACWRASGNDGYMAMISGVPSGNGGGDPGQFYSGLGTLELKFTLPFSGVAPKGLTLDKALGTVVIGSKVAATPPIVYANHPYPTGIATSEAFPTGTSISVVRWI